MISFLFFHNEGYFVVAFTNIDRKNEIMYSGPHMIDGDNNFTKNFL